MTQEFSKIARLTLVSASAVLGFCLVLLLPLSQARAVSAVSAVGTDADVIEKSDQKLPVTFSLLFDSIYDDNIYIRNQNQVGDFYWRVNPGITYQSGDPDYQPDQLLRLWYKPKIYQFLDETKNNSFEQDLLLDYQAHVGELNLGVSQTYYTDATASPDTSGRLKAEYYGTRIFANYELSKRLTWENDATQLLSRYDNAGTIDTNEWTASSFLDYAVCPKLNLALGGTLGYEVLSRSADQYYEQFHLRAKYRVTNTINLTARVGGEFREYEHSNNKSLSPVFSLGAEFHPCQSTTIHVNGEGKTVPSITQAYQDYRTYGVNVSLRQGLVPHLFFNLGTGYYYSFYYNVPSETSAGYQYDYVSVRPGLEWELNEHFTVGAYYQHQSNISHQNDQSYIDNQVGLQGSFKY